MWRLVFFRPNLETVSTWEIRGTDNPEVIGFFGSHSSCLGPIIT